MANPCLSDNTKVGHDKGSPLLRVSKYAQDDPYATTGRPPDQEKLAPTHDRLTALAALERPARAAAAAAATAAALGPLPGGLGGLGGSDVSKGYHAGHAGPTGQSGHAGPTGHTGLAGHAGHEGHPGHAGHAGHAGDGERRLSAPRAEPDGAQAGPRATTPLPCDQDTLLSDDEDPLM